MKTIDRQIREILRKEHKIRNKSINEFEAISKEFDRLVEQGLAKPRGYNLMTIENESPLEMCDYSSNTFELSY